MCSITTVSGYEVCRYLPWSTESDDTQNCTEGNIKRSTLFAVSLIPLGFGKFYSGYYFNGLFELVQGLIAIISVLVWYYCCKRPKVKWLSDILLTLGLFLCYAIEVTHMICSKQFELFYIIMLVISLTLTFALRCCCCCCNDLITVIVTISTMCLLTVGDAFVVQFFKEVDGHGCLLIDD